MSDTSTSAPDHTDRDRIAATMAALPRPDPALTRRSKITNGTKLLPDSDGRGKWHRRAKDLIGEHLSDLGGSDNTSAAERSLVRRAAVLTVELERLEARFAEAEQATADEVDLYGRAASNLRRLLEAVGLKRRPRDVTPTLADLLRDPVPPIEGDCHG